MLVLLALTSHFISGFVPGGTYTVYVDEVPQIEVEVTSLGTIGFDTQSGSEIRIGKPLVPSEEPEAPDPPPAPARFAVAAAPSPTSGPVGVNISIPRAGGAPTRVDLFDARGRRVGGVSVTLSSPGVHRIAWDTSELGSGLYFVRARRGSEVRVTRVLLVR